MVNDVQYFILQAQLVFNFLLNVKFKFKFSKKVLSKFDKAKQRK